MLQENRKPTVLFVAKKTLQATTWTKHVQQIFLDMPQSFLQLAEANENTVIIHNEFIPI